ncbi:MAG: class II fumarate hydratase [Deltaproteobacteria bacterium]|nr:class II fumarate hydratase [Deltaproteobacteria bacterium]
MTEAQRIESDSMGTVAVPAGAYYGAQTARALANFRLSPLRFPRRFIAALAWVKAAAARANVALGLLDEARGAAIEQAAGEVAAGRFDEHFPLDIFQTGSGTSTNMNANEVIANRAAEHLGGARGDKSVVHPNDHVNMGQSTNDVFPTALHVAALTAIEDDLLPALRTLAASLERKAEEFSDIVKAARTHLQDAVPITLGQEFSGYASVVRHDLARLERSRIHLSELAIGGTAAGTGLNAAAGFAARVVAELRALTGEKLRQADNLFEAMQNRDAAVEVSAACRTLAIGLLKLANDLRLLSSGPHTGLNEITLPDLQPGSSIMPGKVNPVIPEAVAMIAAQVIGFDAAIAIAAMNGNLDLNTMMPVIAYDLLSSIDLLATASRTLATRCIDGIQANRERCRSFAESSPAVVTALAPVIGYDAAAALVKQALADGIPIREAVRASGLVPEDRLDALLDLLALTRGGRAGA